jgi:hypothetical protein
MRGYAIGVGAVVIVACVALWVISSVISAREANAPGGQACTLEAKICPDGSAVGRTGPKCEFAECPATDTSTTTATSTTGGGGILPYNSGVRGEVVLGPTCPVERIPPDPACAPRPYATAISVYSTGSNNPFVIGNSNASGAFQFSLSPGSYVLKASGGAVLPRCRETSITVAPDTYATTTIYCDTGIR